MLGRLVGTVGNRFVRLVRETGRLTLTGVDATVRLVRSAMPGERFRGRTSSNQLHLMGVAAVPIVGLISLMMGLILAFQSAYAFEELGMEQYVADLVAVAITRELGPVITAIVMAGRTGSAVAAEISTMKVQEELDALEVMGLDPMSFLIAPKMLAIVIALPVLTALADALGIIGGLACGVMALDMSAETYLERTRDALLLRDFLSGLVKAVMFGGIIVAVGTYCGFNVRGGAEGVGRSTTQSVVLAIFLVIVADLVFTGLFYVFG